MKKLDNDLPSFLLASFKKYVYLLSITDQLQESINIQGPP